MRDILKHTWSVLEKEEKKSFIVLSVLDIVISVVDILSLALLLWIIKFYIQPGQNNLSFLPGWLRDQALCFLYRYFLPSFRIKNIAAFFITKAQYKFIAGVAVRISAINLSNYQQGEFSDFVNIDSSVQIRKISLQPFEFCQSYFQVFSRLLHSHFLLF